MRNQSGFTVMELLTVVAIIGVMAGMAIASGIEWLPKHRLKSATNDLFSNMQRAKMAAIKDRSDRAIVFDASVSPGRYAICSDDGDDDTWDGGFSGGDDPGIDTQVVNLVDYRSAIDFGHGNATSPKGSVFGADVTYTVVFNAAGFIDPPSRYIYLENKDGDTYCVGGLTSGVINTFRWASGGWN